MTSLHRILFNSPYHFLVDLVVIWCVLFFAYTFVFEDLPNLSFMDKSVIWKAGVHLAELVSFILILFVKKVGILIYIIAELMMLCFQIFTEQEETSLYIFVIVFIVTNLLLFLLFLLKKNGKSAWYVLFRNALDDRWPM